MNFKLGALAFIAVNLLVLSACSDDKSSSANSLPDEVADKAELNTYECDMSIIGKKVFVNDLDKLYECDGDHWFVSYDQPKVLRRVAKKEARRRAKVLRLQQSKVLHRALKNYSLVLRVSLRRLLMN